MESKMNHKLFIGDAHTIFRLGLGSLLSRNDHIEVIGDAETASVMLEAVTRMDVDVVIVDYDLPDMDGIETIKHLKQRKPELKTILLSSQDSSMLREEIAKNQINGYILKFQNPDQILKGIQLVLEGNSFVSEPPETRTSTSGDLEQNHPLKKLTRKEKEIMRCLAQGLTYKETGEKLGITVKTVEFHRGNLTRKLGKKSIADITRMSLAWGLIEQDMGVAKTETAAAF